MTGISETNHFHFEKMDLQKREPLSSKSDFEASNQDCQGVTLSEVFGSDVISQKIPIDLSQDSQDLECLKTNKTKEPHNPSFWRKIVAYLFPNGSQGEKNVQASIAKETDALTIDRINKQKPLGAIPELQPPEEIPPEVMSRPFTQPKKKISNDSLTDEQLMNGISQMSERTMESILIVVLKAQFELEKENATIAEETLSKYQHFQKLQEKTLQDVKDILAKDEKMSKIFKTVQDIGSAAHFICGFFSAAALGCHHFNIQHPLLTYVAGIGSFGAAAASAVITGIAGGAKAYFQKRTGEDQAAHEEAGHLIGHYNHCADATREHLMSIAQADEGFKQRLINLLKRYRQMLQILSKS